MPEVILDVTRLLNRGLRGCRPTGVDRVSLEYVRKFRDCARALVRFGGRWLFLNRVHSEHLFELLLHPSSSCSKEIQWCVARAYARPWPATPKRCVLFNTDHSGLEHRAYAARLRELGLRSIFFLHDLIPVTHPEYCRPGQDEVHRRRLNTMLAAGSALILNSQATQRALDSYVAQGGFVPPRTVVAPLAAGRLPPGGGTAPNDSPYFVALGTIESRKNHLLLLHVWRTLSERFGSRAPKLVVIGQRGWECEQVVDMLDRCPPLQRSVEQHRSCNDVDLATWLRHARALLFPSFVEGYGIPIIESFMLNLPVVASDLPVFREVGAQIPDFLDPLDGPAWMRTILNLAQADSELRSAQIERMKGYVPPTWEQHFAIVQSLLEAVGDAP